MRLEHRIYKAEKRIAAPPRSEDRTIGDLSDSELECVIAGGLGITPKQVHDLSDAQLEAIASTD